MSGPPSLQRRVLLVGGLGLLLVSVLASAVLGELFKRNAPDAQVALFCLQAALVVALLLAAWLALLAGQLRGGLRPLQGLAQQVDRIRTGEATQIDRHGLDRDILPLVDALDALQDDHRHALDHAHRRAEELIEALRPPLGTLATEAQGEGRNWRLTVHEQSARMRTSIERYVAAGQAGDPPRHSPVAPAVEALCRLMSRVHGGRGVRVQMDVAPGLVFAGMPADLEAMLHALLDNAGTWAHREVRLRALAMKERLYIEVRDDGPALEERVQGNGPGLATAAGIAGSHGGRLELANEHPGLRARLELPLG